METELAHVYVWVCRSREVLLEYCASLPPADFTRALPGAGWGCVRDTLVHMADAYRWWMDGFALGGTRDTLRPEQFPDIQGVRVAFALADDMVGRFLQEFGDRLDEVVPRSVSHARRATLAVSPRYIFMHAITHEFHHKGQCVMIGRHLGYPPPDTDLIFVP